MMFIGDTLKESKKIEKDLPDHINTDNKKTMLDKWTSDKAA